MQTELTQYAMRSAVRHPRRAVRIGLFTTAIVRSTRKARGSGRYLVVMAEPVKRAATDRRVHRESRRAGADAASAFRRVGEVGVLEAMSDRRVARKLGRRHPPCLPAVGLQRLAAATAPQAQRGAGRARRRRHHRGRDREASCAQLGVADTGGADDAGGLGLSRRRNRDRTRRSRATRQPTRPTTSYRYAAVNRPRTADVLGQRVDDGDRVVA